MERCGTGRSVCSRCFANPRFASAHRGNAEVQRPPAVCGPRHAWKCGTWGQLVSPFCDSPRPPPPPLAPLCSHLSSCPVRSSSAVKPFSMAGAAGVFQVTSFNQPPPLQWAHRSGFPSYSAADPQEALLTQGSGGENGHCPEHVWSLGGGEEGPRLTVGPEVASVIPAHAVHWPELASRSHPTSRGRGVRPSLCLGWARTGHVGGCH